MLTSNLWVEVGLVNGAMGTVKAICYKVGQAPPHLPIAVMVQFDCCSDYQRLSNLSRARRLLERLQEDYRLQQLQSTAHLPACPTPSNLQQPEIVPLEPKEVGMLPNLTDCLAALPEKLDNVSLPLPQSQPATCDCSHSAATAASALACQPADGATGEDHEMHIVFLSQPHVCPFKYMCSGSREHVIPWD